MEALAALLTERGVSSAYHEAIGKACGQDADFLSDITADDLQAADSTLPSAVVRGQTSSDGWLGWPAGPQPFLVPDVQTAESMRAVVAEATGSHRPSTTM